MSHPSLLASAGLAAALIAGLSASHSAQAHGAPPPAHGGVVQVANDVSVELVADADGVTLYLADHGKPLASAGMFGKLTVLQGGEMFEAEIKAAGENTLRVVGVKLMRGAKVVVVLNKAGGKPTTVRFTAK